MSTYKLPDGSLIEAPPDLTPEERQWLASSGAQPVDATPTEQPSSWKDGLKSFLSGTMEGAARAPYIFGDLANLGVRGINKIFPGAIDKDYEKLTSDRAMELLESEGGIYRHMPETTAGRYANAAGAGLGGAAVFGGPRAFVPPVGGASIPGALPTVKALAGRLLRTPAVNAPLAGMAAQGGTDLAGPVGGVTAGLGSQLAMSLLGRSLTPNHPNWIRQGAGDMSPADWKQAEANLAALREAGARQHTLADVVPETSRLRPQTADLTNTTGGAALAEKLSARLSAGDQQLVNGQLVRTGQGDVPRLLQEASDALAPPPNVGAVTQAVASNADDVLRQAREARFNQYYPILEGAPPVPKQDLTNILLAIRARAGNPQNLGTSGQAALDKALKTVGKTPLYPVPQPPTTPGTAVMAGQPPAAISGPPAGGLPPEMGANLVALSKNIKDLKQGVPVPGMGLSKAAGYDAYRFADEALKAHNPAYARAMQTYQDATTQVVNPVKNGLPGQLANLMDVPPNERVLTNVLAKSPLDELRTQLPKVAPDQPLRQQLARVIADQNQVPVTRATPQSGVVDKMRQTVVDLVDPQSGATYSNKTRAADTLAKLTAEAGADPTARQGLSSSMMSQILAPIYEMRIKFNLRLSEREARMLGELIGNPTDENLKLLQRIAQERPDVGGALRQMGRLSSVHTGSTSALVKE